MVKNNACLIISGMIAAALLEIEKKGQMCPQTRTDMEELAEVYYKTVKK